MRRVPAVLTGPQAAGVKRPVTMSARQRRRYQHYRRLRRHDLARSALRLLGIFALIMAGTAVVFGVPVALAPVTVTAGIGWAVAWWHGWPPRRLIYGAVWTIPLVSLWLGLVSFWPAPYPGPLPGAGPGPWWARLLEATYRAWLAMWELAFRGSPLALVAIPPPALPLGLIAGGMLWSRHRFRMSTGTGGRHPAAPARFDRRMWRRQAAAARRIAASALPLTLPTGEAVIGGTIRVVGHPDRPEMVIGYERLRSHQAIVGSTGTGKTTLLLRLWAGFMATGLSLHHAGRARRPLLVAIDCKGGRSSAETAVRARGVLLAAGAATVADWPRTPLSLWSLPADQLVTTLMDLVEHGTGGATYYRDMMGAIVRLAVHAPPGPPASSAEFLLRLNAVWLIKTYRDAGDAGQVDPIQPGIKEQAASVAMRFAELWGKLGAGLDGEATFADADAWYCTLEGTSELATAEAQARALVDLLAHLAVTGDREILLCIDEFSAVSRRVPVWALFERARSLGLAVQVSAQSWEGLGCTDDERSRIVATAEGGVWLLRTPLPDEIIELAGTMDALTTARRQSGKDTWDNEGITSPRERPVVSPQIIRQLGTGQVAYIYRGGVTYAHVKPPAQDRAAGEPGVPGAGPGPSGPQPAGPQAGGAVPGDAPPGGGGWPHRAPADPILTALPRQKADDIFGAALHEAEGDQ
jgi:hypothetical protein